MPTDTEMLNWLEKQSGKHTYTGRCIFRWSETRRGWRLHETTAPHGAPNVRQAIANAMEAE